MAKAVPVLNTSTGAQSESLQFVALSRTRSRVRRGHPPITMTPSRLRSHNPPAVQVARLITNNAGNWRFTCPTAIVPIGAESERWLAIAPQDLWGVLGHARKPRMRGVSGHALRPNRQNALHSTPSFRRGNCICVL